MNERTLIAALLALTVLGAARDASGAAGLFSTDEPLLLTIEADFGALCRNPDREECADVPAVIGYTDEQGGKHSVRAGLRVRGRWKPATANCSLPSLFLVLDRQSAAGTVFEDQPLLPLTTYCRSPLTYEQFMLKEYLAYRIYNLLTSKSLRVRLAHIDYRDSSRRGKPLERYGFFTEHFDSMAARLGGEVFDPGKFDARTADPFEAATLSLFEFMIANLDWSVAAGHNIVYVRGPGWVTAVPFDLDFSGLVDASYAGPPPGFALTRVTERLYRGVCRPDTDWPAVFAHFTGERDAVFSLVDSIPGLDQRNRRRATAFLESFFQIIETPRSRERQITTVCSNP